MTKLVFLKLSDNLFAVNQSPTPSNSLLTTVSKDFKFLSAYNKFVSSANR